MPHPTTPAVVRHPDALAMVVLDPAVDYADDDVLVTTFPQFFAPIENATEIVESVRIERATAAPGERRARKRAAKKAAPSQ